MSVNERGRLIIYGILTEQGRSVINGLTDGGAVEIGSTTAPFKGASSSGASAVAKLTVVRELSGASNTQSSQSASLSGIKVRLVGESFTYVLMGATKLTSNSLQAKVSTTVSGVSKANLSGVTVDIAGVSATVSSVPVGKANLSGAHVDLSGESVTESFAFDAPKYLPITSRDKDVRRQHINPYSTKTGADFYEREDFMTWQNMLDIIPSDLYYNLSTEMLIGEDGTIYLGWQVDSYHNGKYDGMTIADSMNVPTLLAFYPNGTLKWGCHIPSGPRYQVLGSVYKFGEVETLYTFNGKRQNSRGSVVTTNYGSNIYAIDCKTGDIKWVYEYNNNLDVNGSGYFDPQTHFDYVGPVTQGTDGTLYAFAGPGDKSNPNRTLGTVIALNQDGTEKWKLPLGDAGYKAYYNSIAIGDNALYLNFEYTLYAISFEGYILWSKTHPDQVATRSSGTPQEIGTQWKIQGRFSAPSVASDGTIYAGGVQLLWAINPDGSTKLQRKLPYLLLPTNVESLETYGGAVDSQGTFYIGGTGNSDLNLHIVAMESNGTFRWDIELDNFDTFDRSPPTLSKDEKEIIFNTSYGEVLVINTQTGVVSYRSGENSLTESDGGTIIDEKGNILLVNPWSRLVTKFVPKFNEGGGGTGVVCKLIALYDAISLEPIYPVRGT